MIPPKAIIEKIENKEISVFDSIIHVLEIVIAEGKLNMKQGLYSDEYIQIVKDRKRLFTMQLKELKKIKKLLQSQKE
jgi:hypothetical protein